MRRKAAQCLLAVGLLGVLTAGASGGVRVGRLLPLADASGVTAGAGSVWATGPRQVVRIDPVRDVVIARVGLPAVAGSVAFSNRLVWVVTNPRHITAGTAFAPALLYSIDATTNTIVGKPIPLSPMAQGRIVAAAGSLWVTNDQHGRFGRLYRIDPKTRKVVARIAIPNDPFSIVFSHGLLWVGESDSGKVVRVDPGSGSVVGQPIAVGGALLSLAADGDKVWVADTYDRRLITIDAASASSVATRSLPGVTSIAAAHRTLWATIAPNGLVGFDEATGQRVHRRVSIYGGAESVAAVGSYLWVTSSAGITRILHI